MGRTGAVERGALTLRQRRKPTRIFAYAAFGMAVVLSLPIIYLAVHHWINAPDPGELPFHDSFALGDLRAWDGFGMRQLCCDHSAQVEEAPQLPGARAVRFILNRSDPDVKGSRRAELRLRAAEWGHEYEYSMRIFVPKDWVLDRVPVTVVQWHNVPDLWRLESPLPSVLRLDVRGDQWVAEFDSGTGPDLFDRERHVQSLILCREPLDREHWTNWRFHMKWSRGDDGIIEIWKDDRLLARHVGPSAYADSLAPYLKFGLYAFTWKVSPDLPTTTDRREIWFRDVNVVELPRH